MTQAISPLRQRMIEDMRMRKFSPKTQSHYICAVRQFAGYLGRSPDTATVEELRGYQLHLADSCDLAGADGCTTKTIGVNPNRTTGTKSLVGS